MVPVSVVSMIEKAVSAPTAPKRKCVRLVIAWSKLVLTSTALSGARKRFEQSSRPPLALKLAVLIQRQRRAGVMVAAAWVSLEAKRKVVHCSTAPWVGMGSIRRLPSGLVVRVSEEKLFCPYVARSRKTS